MSSLLIWDDNGEPIETETFDHIFFFKSQINSNIRNSISIPKIVEDNSVYYREKYLTWSSGLSEVKFCGDKLREKLKLRPNLSAWWLSGFYENTNYVKSSYIEDVIRLMALVEKINE